jgi:putative hydrolase of the HAD superfamily
LTSEQIRSRFSTALRRSFHADLAGLERPPTDELREVTRWRTIVAEVLDDLPEKTVHRVFEQLWDYFADPAAWTVLPDVLPAFDLAARAQLQIAIASNFDQRLDRIVAGLPELAAVRRVCISSSLGWCKPDRRFYEAVARHLGEGETPILGMIGDDRLHDVIGAQHAGWQAVLVDRTERESTAAATLVEAVLRLLRATEHCP